MIMTYVVIGLVIFLIFIFFLWCEYRNFKDYQKKLLDSAEKSFGTLNEKETPFYELQSCKAFFNRFKTIKSIDDITANDLEIDELFSKFNKALSAPGKEYFYYRMRTGMEEISEREDFERKVSFLQNDRESRRKLQSAFFEVGSLPKVSFFECLDLYISMEDKKPVKEYITFFLPFIAFASFFISSTAGIVLTIAAFIYNILCYYKVRGEIEAYIICFVYISNFIKVSRTLKKIDIEVLKDELDEITERADKMKAFEKFSSFISSRSKVLGAGNPLDIIFDYLSMVFHLDILAFYKMLSFIKNKKYDIEDLYFRLGKLECYGVVASIRTSKPEYCVPTKGEGIEAVNVYHPLIDNPVKNSISAKNGVLITGSNASGKSTFLKTVALNALFADSLNTCFADSFSLEDFCVFSSMSLRDDLQHKDSYFMVEIKALKRIFDFAKENPDRKLLCFVDEVLRGTNTIERIASCTQILKKINEINILCFAATHDIELTDLLNDSYDNYHFDEQIIDNDVLFSYKLKEGKATSKNAISLLSIMGFDESIINNARTMADNFTNNGVWEKIC